MSITDLRNYLEALPPGPVTDKSALIAVLSTAWDDFVGSDTTAMAARKLPRIEKPRWAAPILSFDIERHGATMLGSTRAEVQTWDIDMNARDIEINATFRQVRPTAKRLDVRPLAMELALSIRNGDDRVGLRWSDDRQQVTVRAEVFVPASGPKETVAGRRRRLHEAVAAAVAPDWSPGARRGQYRRNVPVSA